MKFRQHIFCFLTAASLGSVQEAMAQTTVPMDTVVTASQDTVLIPSQTVLVVPQALPGGTVATTPAMAYNTTYATPPANEVPQRGHRLHRMDREIQKMTFIKKGSWFCGGALSYSETNADNINMLLVKDIDVTAYTFGVSPYFGYFFRNNVAVGLRGNYGRTNLDLKSFGLNLGEDFNINLKDLYYLQQHYEGSLFIRTYQPLGRSKVFGFFAEMRGTYGYSESKHSTGKPTEETYEGTFGTAHRLGIGFAPGLAAFVNDFMSCEVQLGVLGYNFRWTDQMTNRVEHGKQRTTGGQFKIDLFSINIGTTFYF